MISRLVFWRTGLIIIASFAANAADQPFVFEPQAAISDIRPLTLHSELEAEGLKLRASIPAAEEPAGNWGFENRGFQASVRMRKERFRIGEPVIAWAIMRNIAVTSQVYHVSIPDVAWDISLTTNDGQLGSKVKQQRIVQGGYDRVLPPFHQMLHIFSLGNVYDLTRPGKYFVTMTRTVFLPGESASAQISTGTAVFEISDSGTHTNQTLPVTMKPSLVKDDHPISAFSGRGIRSASNTFPAGPQSNNPSSTPYFPAVDRDKTANTDLPQGSGDTGVRGKGSLAVIGIALFGLVLAVLLRRRSKS